MQWQHQQRGRGETERGQGRENKSPRGPQDRTDMGPLRHRKNSSWVVHKTPSWKQSNCPSTEKYMQHGYSLTGILYVNGNADCTVCAAISIEQKRQVRGELSTAWFQ